ncbi:MAG: hypothetical protein PHV85_00010 [Desulfovibrionaceae bacterium]|nr:hypothetical protein [Desulfovibrionaceae bacterium]
MTSKYGQSAMTAEAMSVAGAGRGLRNNALNGAAYNLGQLVGGGEIDREDAVSVLLDAAVAAGLHPQEARPTIESGLRSGAAEPRSAPESTGAAYRPLRPPRRPTARPSAPKAGAEPPEKWQRKAGALVEFAHRLLLESDSQLEYLAGRGIGRDAVREHRLGWLPGETGAPPAYFRSRRSWGLGPKPTGKPDALWIPRGLVIPCSREGKLVRVRIRRPGEDLARDGDSKYIVLPGSGAHTFLAGDGDKAFVVVEAELDAVLVAQEAGDLATAAGLGSSSVKPDADTATAMAGAVSVLVALDFDRAGAKAWPWWEQTFDRAKRWPSVKGKDPGDDYQAGVDVRSWVLAGLPPALCSGEGMVGLQTSGLRVERAHRNIPGPLVELLTILRGHPVRIVRGPKGPEVDVPDKHYCYRAPNVIGRAVRLVEFDRLTRDYLARHPDRVITARNLLGPIGTVGLPTFGS